MASTREDLLVDISQRLRVMREQESSDDYVVPDYLAAEWQQGLRDVAAQAAASSSDDAPTNGEDPSPSPSQISVRWRETICEWCYQVVDHFNLNREVVSVAMNYLDRYLATRIVNRRIFQLAAITAMHLAIDLFEPGKLRMSSLIDLSRGFFVAEHIVTMEDSMLRSIPRHAHPPTPFAFCRDLHRLIPGDVSPRARQGVNELARFLTELSVCDYWFVTKKPSSIALASLINAIELQGPARVDPRHKVEFIHRVLEVGMDIANDDEIIECYERLREIYEAGLPVPGVEDPANGGHAGDPVGVAG